MSGLRKGARSEEGNWDVDIPNDAPPGKDAFCEHGAYLLFLDMLRSAAVDLSKPSHTDVSDGASRNTSRDRNKSFDAHADAKEWLNDPIEMSYWRDMLNIDALHFQRLIEIVQQNPKDSKTQLTIFKQCIASSGYDHRRLIRTVFAVDSALSADPIEDTVSLHALY